MIINLSKLWPVSRGWVRDHPVYRNFFFVVWIVGVGVGVSIYRVW